MIVAAPFILLILFVHIATAAALAAGAVSTLVAIWWIATASSRQSGLATLGFGILAAAVALILFKLTGLESQRWVAPPVAYLFVLSSAYGWPAAVTCVVCARSGATRDAVS